MDARTRAALAQRLHRQREALLKRFFDAEADLRSIADEREPELEERAQEECATRVLASLDDRSLGEIAEIDSALQRIIDGTYGKCLDCGRALPLARLRVVPTAAFCVECARQEEVTGPRDRLVPGQLPRSPGSR
jgi:RNA polymerase-binding protein DksA